MTRLRAALAALALTVTVLLTGCAGGTANTTAVINGVVIRESTVDDMAEALVSSGAYSSYAEARSSASSNLIVGEVARQVAAKDGIALTPPDLPTLSKNNPTFATFLATPLGEEFATDHVNGSQVINQVPGWQAEFAAVKVQLNPRYGTWSDYISSSSGTVPTGSMSAVSGS
ncbi:MAG TPA: hypothetical protein VLS51_07785 [Propionibacteriaceae bacterium]|nr:hypothetical protein [Propionibacteriaceae bacterium]